MTGETRTKFEANPNAVQVEFEGVQLSFLRCLLIPANNDKRVGLNQLSVSWHILLEGTPMTGIYKRPRKIGIGLCVSCFVLNVVITNVSVAQNPLLRGYPENWVNAPGEDAEFFISGLRVQPSEIAVYDVWLREKAVIDLGEPLVEQSIAPTNVASWKDGYDWEPTTIQIPDLPNGIYHLNIRNSTVTRSRLLWAIQSNLRKFLSSIRRIPSTLTPQQKICMTPMLRITSTSIQGSSMRQVTPALHK